MDTHLCNSKHIVYLFLVYTDSIIIMLLETHAVDNDAGTMKTKQINYKLVSLW